MTAATTPASGGVRCLLSGATCGVVRDGDQPSRRLVTNDHRIDEAPTRLKNQASMRNATLFVTILDESDRYRFESVSEAVFLRAQETFVTWTDLDASVADFVVAAQMDDMGIDHVRTYDRHDDAFDVTTLPSHEPDEQ